MEIKEFMAVIEISIIFHTLLSEEPKQNDINQSQKNFIYNILSLSRAC